MAKSAVRRRQRKESPASPRSLPRGRKKRQPTTPAPTTPVSFPGSVHESEVNALFAPSRKSSKSSSRKSSSSRSSPGQDPFGGSVGGSFGAGPDAPSLAPDDDVSEGFAAGGMDANDVQRPKVRMTFSLQPNPQFVKQIVQRQTNWCGPADGFPPTECGQNNRRRGSRAPSLRSGASSSESGSIPRQWQPPRRGNIRTLADMAGDAAEIQRRIARGAERLRR